MKNSTINKMSDYKEVGEIVYNKLDAVEGILQDMYLALGYKNGELKSETYDMTFTRAQINLDKAEDLIADLITINKETHYRQKNDK